jgi:hypothetical protein
VVAQTERQIQQQAEILPPQTQAAEAAVLVQFLRRQHKQAAQAAAALSLSNT